MNRRDALRALFVLGVAGQPMFARAQTGAGTMQTPQGTRRVGVLLGYTESDPEGQQRFVRFRERLAALGWIEGRNLTLDVRWTAGDFERIEPFAKELVALNPDAILAATTPVTAALQRETKTIPIVFAAVADPIGSGFAQTMARPGGNITGFTNLEASLMEKWLQLLKEIAPRVKRVGVMFNPKTAAYADFYLERLNKVASKVGVKTFTAPVGSAADIERVISALGRKAGGGLILMPDTFTGGAHRKAIIDLTARHKVPAIHYLSVMAIEGGLISYGVDAADLFRRAGDYVSRILQGANPASLPVQQPTLFELVVNLKTAKALGLTIPQSVLILANKVIE